MLIIKGIRELLRTRGNGKVVSPAGIENVFIAMFYKGYLSGDFLDTIMDTIKR